MLAHAPATPHPTQIAVNLRAPVPAPSGWTCTGLKGMTSYLHWDMAITSVSGILSDVELTDVNIADGGAFGISMMVASDDLTVPAQVRGVCAGAGGGLVLLERAVLVRKSLTPCARGTVRCGQGVSVLAHIQRLITQAR